MAKAKRRVVVCDECGGSGEKKPNAFKMIANIRLDECPKCKGEGHIRVPLPATGED